MFYSISTKDEEDEDNSDGVEESEENDSDGEENMEDEDGDDDGSEELDDDEKDEEEARKRRLDDLDQGKTVFLKCVPFTATEEDLRECCGKFGPIAYALICVDRVTDHSKGTAFVKFRVKNNTF